mmetsp:Transcript_53216/g.168979  ORF Transcript_53216/g.168979 Transcript_53216/m.168979 type:complete len:218 (-) Transcript_53216:706-1359(-)
MREGLELAAHLPVLVVAVHDDVHLGAHPPPREARLDVLLQGDDLVPPRLPHLGVDLCVVLRRGGAVLLRVGEHPEPLELELLDEVHQLAVVRLRLPREARDKGGAEAEAGDAVAKAVEEVHGVLLGRAVHGEEGDVGDVLQGDVDVLHHLGHLGDGLDQLLAEVRGVGVEDADPFDALDLVKLPQQLREPPPIRLDVHAVLVGVLRDQVELLHAHRR